MVGKKNRGVKLSKATEVKKEEKDDTDLEIKSEDESVDNKIGEVDIKEKKPIVKKNLKDWRYFQTNDKSKKKSKSTRGVVYVKCLPHGFYEKQLEGYFGQFGKVTGVYVPKSNKTGRAKGYGFIEFVDPEVAKIAAETMNNYLMFNRLIKTEIIPHEKQKPYMFSDKYKKMKHQYSESKAKENVKKRRKLLAKNRSSYITRAADKISHLQESLNNLGVDYKFKIAGLREGVTLTGLKNIDPEKINLDTTNLKNAVKKTEKVADEVNSTQTVTSKKKKKGVAKEEISSPISTKKGTVRNFNVDIAAVAKIASSAKVNIKAVKKVKRKTTKLGVSQKQPLSTSKEKLVKSIDKVKKKVKDVNTKKKKNAVSPSKRQINNKRIKKETTV